MAAQDLSSRQTPGSTSFRNLRIIVGARERHRRRNADCPGAGPGGAESCGWGLGWCNHQHCNRCRSLRCPRHSASGVEMARVVAAALPAASARMGLAKSRRAPRNFSIAERLDSESAIAKLFASVG